MFIRVMIVRCCFRWGEKLVSMAIDAVKRVRTVVDGRVEVDVKRYARVEKIPGGEMEDSMVRQRARERVREKK